MFLAPTNCNFFRIENNQIILQPDCNLATTSKMFFHCFMEKITRNMSYMLCLENFCSQVFNGSQTAYESYAQAIQQCLEPFKIALLEKETETASQMKIISVLNFLNEMEFHFTILECLHEIHKTCILECNPTATADICSMFMLSSLLKFVNCSSNLIRSNLALSIYLTSFKGFFSIIESWWTTGGLSDEILLNETIIEEDVVIKIILKNSHRAGNTFNILRSLDRLHMIYFNSSVNNNLHNLFLMKIFEELEKFKASNENEEWIFVERTSNIVDEPKKVKNLIEKRYSLDEMIFASFDDDDDDEGEDDENLMEINAFSLYIK